MKKTNFILFFIVFFNIFSVSSTSVSAQQAYGCGDKMTTLEAATPALCQCSSGIKPLIGNTKEVCCGWVHNGLCQSSPPPSEMANCGENFDNIENFSCPTSCPKSNISGFTQACCGYWVLDENSQATSTNLSEIISCHGILPATAIKQSPNDEYWTIPLGKSPTSQDQPAAPIQPENETEKTITETTSLPPGAGSGSQQAISGFQGVTTGVLDALNPLKIGGTNQSLANQLSTPGGILSRVLEFAFPLAGLILFVMILWGGFEMVYGAASKNVNAGKQRITAALVGFLLLFCSYWIVQIIELIFGVKILY